jgi:predicted phosphodiesterase
VEHHRLRAGTVALALSLLLSAPVCLGQATIVQISDTHVGLSTAPHALTNLQSVVTQINAMSPQPDAVIVSGDIGENTSDWQMAKNALALLNATVYYCPGNHDIHTTDIATYRQYFGNDYYSFKINNITFMVIDSQLLGNFDTFTSGQTTPSPVPSNVQAESTKMFNWLSNQSKVTPEIAVQHIPLLPDTTGTSQYPSTNPYWFISDPYRTSEKNQFTRLAITHLLAGHWHNQRTFTDSGSGITIHAAPASAYAIPSTALIGYTIHTIIAAGAVTTQAVKCGACQ